MGRVKSVMGVLKNASTNWRRKRPQSVKLGCCCTCNSEDERAGLGISHSISEEHYLPLTSLSAADLGCFSRILDPNFSILDRGTGSKRSRIRIRIKECK